jgi:hypothetical protein
MVLCVGFMNKCGLETHICMIEALDLSAVESETKVSLRPHDLDGRILQKIENLLEL